MRRIIGFICSIILMGCSSPDVSHLEKSAVIPYPVKNEKIQGKFVFTKGTRWALENEGQVRIAGQLKELFRQAAGFEMENETFGDKENVVFFCTDTLLRPEAYRLEVTPGSIRIHAASDAGFFYATQTLRQLLPPGIESLEKVNGVEWSVPACRITDEPRFGYRGFMLDVVRYFMPKENLMRLIDYIGMLKINKLHLHLVDDQGWRLEIKSHPKLTEVGAWRVERKEYFPGRPAPEAGEPTPIGGFYTQDDMKEIIAYAASKSIEVIPEIEMPAHSTAAIAAYPELACDTKGRFVGVLPGFGGFAPVYCAGKEEVFHFLEDVLDEVIALFPSRYVHVGGDEATKEYWKACPYCQARMKSENIPNEEELQSYFMRRINSNLKSKGKILIGWDELTNSELPEDAVVLGWRGMGNAALKAAEQGHPYIMAPARIVYLIRYQGPQWFEPRTYFGNNTLLDVYNYEPVKNGLSPELAQLMMGVQACLWTEFTNSPQEAEYLLFPRLTALAEVAWSPKGQRNWEHYLNRLDQLLLHYDVLGIHYARSMFNLDHEVYPDNGTLNVKLSCIRSDMNIRYTQDGTEPTAQSLLYTERLKQDKSGRIKAATFKEGKQMGKTLILDLKVNKATAKTINGKNDKLYLLINGLKGSDKQSDSEWCGWYGQDAEFVVDLWDQEKIHTVELGTISDYGMGVHLPERLLLSVSDDGVNFKEVARKENGKDEIFARGIHTGKISFTDLNLEGRYLKVAFTNPGKCPEGHVRQGQPTWVYFDEIVVE